ncbi:hypothetical protein SCHPADRAFT_899710 [Schizopora paradoxa]|uniref:F-box domain-containing protein n=1 Tax=Schizopora paradoxa TaxID=27342 RepID=A0A0H2S3F6_9AGAM|nr:hypothetical protein SCHPADRAFT_899710 [Schizopora paradoxa]
MQSDHDLLSRIIAEDYLSKRRVTKSSNRACGCAQCLFQVSMMHYKPITKASRRDPYRAIVMPQIDCDIDKLCTMIRNWKDTGSPQDREDRQKELYLNKILRAKPSPLTCLEEARELRLMATNLHESLRESLTTLVYFNDVILRELETADKRLEDIGRMFRVTLLPDDILSYIFDLVLEGDEYRDRTALDLASVCRRFRSVALGTSSLWSVIRGASRYSAEMQQKNAIFLNRSRTYPLDIDFEVTSRKYDYVTIDRFMRDLTPHSNRWKSFRISFDGSKNGVNRFFESLKKLGLDNIHTPNLERLSIVINFSLNSWLSDNLLELLRWDAPKLRILELEDFAVDLRNLNSITHISLTIFTIDFPFDWIYGLESLPPLCSLNLGIRCTLSKMTSSTNLTLSSLRHLSLFIRIDSKSSHKNLLSNVHCPNITDLSIHISVVDDASHRNGPPANFIPPCFEYLFGNASKQFSHLSQLRLKTEAARLDDYSVFRQAVIELPLFSFPNLSHLFLEGAMKGLARSSPLPIPKAQQTDGAFPSLKVVEIQSLYSEMLRPWVQDVCDLLSLQSKWENFEKLVIRKAVETDNGTIVNTPTTLCKEELLLWSKEEN